MRAHLAIAAAAFATWVAASDVATPPGAALPWRELVLEGRKLGLDAAIHLHASLQPTTDAAGEWLPAGATGGVRPAGTQVLLFESRTAFAGRVLNERLWLDPASRAAIQIDDTETGARDHRRVYRLLTGGFIYEQRLPGHGEEGRDPATWTDVQRSVVRYPGATPATAVVTGALALLGSDLVATLRAPGDRVSCLVLVQSQLEAVTVAAVAASPYSAAFVEHRGDGDHPVSGPLDTLTLELVSRPVDENAPGSFRLFGLEHGIQVVWEPHRRVPLRISGQVRLLGQIVINLEEIRY
ncbi:MAG: hypothetical protein KA072_05515 [Thermoanaerobaculaceae bacterium]|nr:hypothetical protein [Thermoanaerobaculaceae bacterium]MDI9622690.1 hypothetical protein [Acidobacteriota bacterium]NLH11012.1 hypothetical protein [Holophagae bacterium]